MSSTNTNIYVWGPDDRIRASMKDLEAQILRESPNIPARGFDHETYADDHGYAELHNTALELDLSAITKQYPDLNFTAMEDGVDWDGHVEHWAAGGRVHKQDDKTNDRPHDRMILTLLRATPENEEFSLNLAGAWPDQATRVITSIHGGLMPAFLNNVVKKEPYMSKMSVEAITDDTLLLAFNAKNDIQKNNLTSHIAEVAQHFGDTYSFRVVTFQDVALGQDLDLAHKREAEKGIHSHLATEAPDQGKLDLGVR